MIYDIVIILLFLLSISRGIHRGGIKSIFGVLTFIISFAIAFGCRNFLANWALKLPFAEKIATWAEYGASTVVGEASKLPFISGGIESGATTLTYFILQVISIITVFLIVAIILGFLAKALTAIVRFIQLGFVNRILGGILGALSGYIIIYIITLICFALSGLVPGIATALIGSNLAHNLINPITLIGNIINLFI